MWKYHLTCGLDLVRDGVHRQCDWLDFARRLDVLALPEDLGPGDEVLLSATRSNGTRSATRREADEPGRLGEQQARKLCILQKN